MKHYPRAGMDIDLLIDIWSMRPKPGTSHGDAWEAGARQGWKWAQDEIERLRAEVAEKKE